MNTKRHPSKPGTYNGTARCYMCENIKPASEFYKDRSRSAGLSSRCKLCQRKHEDRLREETAELNRKTREILKEVETLKGIFARKVLRRAALEAIHKLAADELRASA